MRLGGIADTNGIDACGQIDNERPAQNWIMATDSILQFAISATNFVDDEIARIEDERRLRVKPNDPEGSGSGELSLVKRRV